VGHGRRVCRRGPGVDAGCGRLLWVARPCGWRPLREEPIDPVGPKPPHRPVKAKSVIFLFMFGGPSQLDLFDYKPELQKRDGQTIDNEFRRKTKTKAVLQASRRTFRQHGVSGLWCSDALPHLARHMDKLAVVKSLYSDSFAHGQRGAADEQRAGSCKDIRRSGRG
jgi:hypothetical protein